MWIVRFKDREWLNLDEFMFGPFNSHDDAYDFCCELPSPSVGGHKYIEQVYKRSAEIGCKMVEGRRNRYNTEAFKPERAS